MKKPSILFYLGFLSITGAVSGSQIPRGTQFWARVDDGTPKVLTAVGPAEPVEAVPSEKEEFLTPDMAPPPVIAKPKRVVLDRVPENKKKEILRRLNLVKELVAEHGLAVDYRVIPTKDLAKLLERLNRKKIEKETVEN